MWRPMSAGVVAAGAVAPSTSAGVSAWKPKPERSVTAKRWYDIGLPASIAARLIAYVAELDSLVVSVKRLSPFGQIPNFG